MPSHDLKASNKIPLRYSRYLTISLLTTLDSDFNVFERYGPRVDFIEI